ncbi:MAG: hypothetical protein NPIRA05_01900 [Nitrospirales bacterium]|nr:MAG: hypothetical protein NPIRA05_01900 [Nitrospirales bacterium]
MLDGIRKYIKTYNEAKGKRQLWTVEPVELPYGEEEAGLQLLLEVIRKQAHQNLSNEAVQDSVAAAPAVDVILGPSDSGLYLSLMEFKDDLEAAKVVVLSPVVTAKEGNKPNEWLFRANVQVVKRAQKIFDYLVSRGFNTITVAYESSSFGDMAELAFSELAGEKPQINYKALRFRSGQLRGAASTIVDERPSAVGLLGRTEHVRQLQRALNAVTPTIVPYDPLVFAITDASTLCLKGVRFVTLYKKQKGSTQADPGCGNPPGSMTDEFTELGYDTAKRLLRIADKIGTDSHGTIDWRTKFRYELAASFETPNGRPSKRTGMAFLGRENTAEPTIRWYEGVVDGKDVFADVTTPTSGWSSWWTWWKDRIEVRQRRFGLVPLINITFVVAIVGILTFLDVNKSFTAGRARRYLWRWTFLRLALFNVFVAVAVLFAMAEWGDVRWDNTLVALSVAFGYTMLLKTTIFETSSGQAFGLAQFYEKILKNINRRLMVMRYELEAPRVYFLSYTNSRNWLREVLVRVYRESEDSDRADRLIADIDRDVGTIDGEVEKRRVYARILLDLMNWPQLVRAHLLPFNIKEHELFDPTTLLRAAAHYSSQVRPENGHKINAMVTARLTQIREQNTGKVNKAIKDELDERIAKSTTERGRTYVRLDWLVIQQFISLDQLQPKGLVDPAFDPRPLRSRLTSWLADFIPRHPGAMNKPADDPTGERRSTRRLNINGNASLTWRHKIDDEPEICAAHLLNVSTGGIGLLLDNSQPIQDVQRAAICEVDIAGETLTLKDCVDYRGHNDFEEKTRLNLQWINPSQETLAKVTEYVKAAS